MDILREVHCRVMKGCGPDWVDKNITVYFDDIDPETPDSVIYDMVIYEAKRQLKAGGFTHYTIKEIHNA